jgi:sirohydrochlorin cobaltochelatase
MGRKALTMKSRALVLFAHGARDRKWALPFHRLRQLVQEALPDAVVSLAYLELMTPDLPELVRQLVQGGCDDVTIVPVFLAQSGHVMRELPLIISQLEKDHAGVVIRLAGAVGEDPDVLAAMARYCIGSLAGVPDASH